jgi:hypothetical protein
MARVRITKRVPKALSGLEMKMSAGLYGKGTNGNSQFRKNGHLEAGKISQQPTEVRDTLQPVARDGANLEAERGETAMVNIDGIPAHFKIGGKRHSEGGTPLNLPDNSFIFSDTAKMKIKDPIMLAQFGMVPKKSGYTPAEIAKKYDINKFRQVLADPNSEDVDRSTAELMISKYNMKLAKLALVQESSKGFPQGIPVVAMPYVMASGMNPEELLQVDTQGQEEQSDEDMGVSKYGGGLMRAQTGATMPAATSSYNVPLQINKADMQYTEPDMAEKVFEGLNAVMEAPQRAMMWYLTSRYGDDDYEMMNPKTGKPEMVNENNVEEFTKKYGYVPTGKKTNIFNRGHYEMPGESLKRNYPESSPGLQFTADVLADPLIAASVWKTAGRLATRSITKQVTKAVYKEQLKGLGKTEALNKILESAGKLKKGPASERNKRIANEVLSKVKTAYAKNPNMSERALDKISASSGHNAAIRHDAKYVAKEAVEAADVVAKAAASRAKKIYEGAAPIVKKIAKGTEAVVKGAVEAVDSPVGGPLVKSVLKNIPGSASKQYKISENEKRRAKEEKEALDWRSAGVDPIQNKIGLFTNVKKPGTFYYQAGFKPYTKAVEDSLIQASKPKDVQIIKNKPAVAPSATVAPIEKDSINLNWD